MKLDHIKLKIDSEYKCRYGHDLKEVEKARYMVCYEADCNGTKYYPKDKVNFYHGFDELRKRSIIDNNKTHFIY